MFIPAQKKSLQITEKSKRAWVTSGETRNVSRDSTPSPAPWEHAHEKGVRARKCYHPQNLRLFPFASFLFLSSYCFSLISYLHAQIFPLSLNTVPIYQIPVITSTLSIATDLVHLRPNTPCKCSYVQVILYLKYFEESWIFSWIWVIHSQKKPQNQKKPTPP